MADRSTVTAADILERAADLLDREGWTQGISMNRHGARCMSRALFDAGRGHLLAKVEPDTTPAPSLEAFRACEQEISLDDRPGLLVSWNDAPGRTKEEVTTALRNAVTYLANTGRAVTVRFLFGDYPIQDAVNSKRQFSKIPELTKPK